MDVSTFPISFSYHLIFCLVAGGFFLMRFIRYRHPYQLLLTIAIPASLLIYLGTLAENMHMSDAMVTLFSGKGWFHTIGVFELVLLIGALILSVIDRVRNKKKSAAEAETESAEQDGTVS